MAVMPSTSSASTGRWIIEHRAFAIVQSSHVIQSLTPRVDRVLGGAGVGWCVRLPSASDDPQANALRQQGVRRRRMVLVRPHVAPTIATTISQDVLTC
jgi:hypothetical protein